MDPKDRKNKKNKPEPQVQPPQPPEPPEEVNYVDETALTISEAEAQQKIYTPGMLIRRRFFSRKIAVFGLVVFSIIVLLVLAYFIFGDPQDSVRVNRAFRNEPPSADFWLGTDTVGRDMFARLMQGGQVSLLVGVVAVLIQVLIGMLVGGIAGFYGGWVDNLLMRFLEIVQSFPFTPLAITVSALLGSRVTPNQKLLVVIGLIGFLSWPGLARMIRGQILSLREMEFVQAAKALGVRDGRIITRHLLPNTVAYIIVNATIGMAGAILSEAALSFLGLGVPPSTPTWGNLINAGSDMYILQNRPWLWVPPGVAIFLTVMCVNLIGDGMRDAIDPKSR